MGQWHSLPSLRVSQLGDCLDSDIPKGRESAGWLLSTTRRFVLFSARVWSGEVVSEPVNAKWDTSVGGGPCQTWLGPQSVVGQAPAPWQLDSGIPYWDAHILAILCPLSKGFWRSAFKAAGFSGSRTGPCCSFCGRYPSLHPSHPPSPFHKHPGCGE